LAIEIFQMLTFMRTDLCVSTRPVLSIVLSDIVSSLTHSLVEIRGTLIEGNFGMNNISKDFLAPGSLDQQIVRNKNCKRRRCEVVFLDMLDAELAQRVKAG
jgi:hypothetical protein